MNITLSEISSLLCSKDNFYILTHQYPDGDTLGSGFALCMALQKMGKMAKVLCNDEIPKKYNILLNNIKIQIEQVTLLKYTLQYLLPKYILFLSNVKPPVGVIKSIRL